MGASLLQSLSVSILSMTPRPKKLLAAIASVAAASVILSGCSTQETQPETHEGQVGVQLFMWNWEAVAAECEWLGANGVDWVLTSPPQEHILGSQWWTVYQPVSYQLESRLGSREEFAAMVQTCGDNGVEIIADAVINHMAGISGGTGYAGTDFSKYDYPGLYSREDFHSCEQTLSGEIENYGDRDQVQNCELLGLSDLDQSNPHVQEQILGYLNDLLSLGVAGFRIDAAKHISAMDLSDIVNQLPEGTRVLQEVIRGGGEPITPEQYLATGEVWEFSYARTMKRFFGSRSIIGINSEFRFDGHTPSDQTISFVSNHDTERNRETLTYANPLGFELATAMMLAENYGQPMLYSSYAFDDREAGPLERPDGVLPAECSTDERGFVSWQDSYQANDWICQHRLESTVAMIGFRDWVGSAPVVEKHRDSGVYGFAREGRGYFIVNVSLKSSNDVSVVTTLPDGEYTDLIGGSKLTIKDGLLTTTIAPETAIAITTE